MFWFDEFEGGRVRHGGALLFLLHCIKRLRPEVEGEMRSSACEKMFECCDSTIALQVNLLALGMKRKEDKIRSWAAQVDVYDCMTSAPS